MLRQIFFIKLKISGTPNFIGQIRSNLTFKVFLKVRKAKNAKSLKSAQYFGGFFGEKR